ncbi:hypothetical protein F2Q69_00040751 [Brassica cretica]|uniref:Uncharacterized protein n=1 Tax=Brassica cretica TaxID=69181 RepID=A0A8S9NKL5_BRACR|nr:hypothetical protein F2Q69_00040751 [Brassica cretica]
MRTHETRVHRKNYIPTENVPRTIPTEWIPRYIPTNSGRRNIPTDIGSSVFFEECSPSVLSEEPLSVGIFRRPEFPHEFSNPLNVFFRKQIGVRIQMRKLLTALRRLSDGCKAVRRNTVGIFQSQTAIQRSYIYAGNGHMVRRKFVGKFRRNTDDCTVNRNVVGSSSVYFDEFPTMTTVTFFIGMSSKSRRKIPTSHVSSEFRRKWPTEFRRLQIFGFRRKLVGNPSQTSDDIDVRLNFCRNSACFLVVSE